MKSVRTAVLFGALSVTAAAPAQENVDLGKVALGKVAYEKGCISRG
jgi:hypothetical protein